MEIQDKISCSNSFPIEGSVDSTYNLTRGSVPEGRMRAQASVRSILIPSARLRESFENFSFTAARILSALPVWNLCLSIIEGGRASTRDESACCFFARRSTIIAAVNKMFLDCAFAVMHQEQALWPDILADLA